MLINKISVNEGKYGDLMRAPPAALQVNSPKPGHNPPVTPRLSFQPAAHYNKIFEAMRPHVQKLVETPIFDPRYIQHTDYINQHT